MNGYIHSYESLATLDGKGVRFCVFMSGCPLRCVYCHNPDTQFPGENAITPEALIKKIIRYKPYFGKNGGVTFSGGEPLIQADFIKETVPLLQKEDISYTVDTSCDIKLTESVKFVLQNARLVIADIKFYNRDLYEKYTGGNLENVISTLSFLKEKNVPVWARTVIVPHINDKKEHIKAYAEFAEKYNNIEKYELLPFHTMGFNKYEKSGLINPLAHTEAMDKEKCKNLQEYLDKQMKRRI